MTRSATSWSGSTAGPKAPAARVARAPRSPATAGTTSDRTVSATAARAAAAQPLRRPDRHRPGRAPPAAAGLGAVPVPDGPQPFQPADRPRAGPEPVRRATHDRAVAPRLGGQDLGGDAGR